jgi:hypothetical protein
MANAPLMGQDGGSYGFDLPDGASEIFFRSRLDGWNRLELAQELRADAHAHCWFCRPIFLMQVGPPWA